MSSPEPRLAGLSGLAWHGGRLRAVTDSGVVVDLPLPGGGGSARFRDLPAGPGYPTFKRDRDSESLAWDARRRGWWVGFEFRHSLWFYDEDFVSGQEVLSLRDRGWTVNGGVEGLVVLGGRSLLLPERGDSLLKFSGGRIRTIRLSGATGAIAEAAQMPDGRVLVAERRVGWGGISNRLAWLRREGDRYRLEPIATLPLGPFDNVEGLAAQPLPDGRTRVWAVTDNDGWRRTLLLALDLPGQRKAARDTGRGGL